MDWTPLVVKDLPRILCGPILRRVDSSSVTVWVALHHKELDEATDEVLLEVFLRKTGELVMDGKLRPTRIGDVYVATVQATGTSLLSSSHYLYRLSFSGSHIFGHPPGESSAEEAPESDPSQPEPEAEAEPADIEDYAFQFMPQELSAVRIAHASCRKPDGLGRDALALLQDAIDRKKAQKPHLLFLTGDQIYADGVAAPLLVMIRDAVNKLLPGVSETGSETPGGDVAAMLPLRRIPLLAKAGIVFSYPPDCHLVTFAEYFMMYLFAWSDVLWGTTVFPGWESVKRVFTGLPSSPEYTWEERKLWLAQYQNLQAFHADLPKVRRLLQTTPTLMIFDDHDVTDDWRLNDKWNQEVLKTDLGSDIQLNALLAYILNQAAGNNPPLFKPKIDQFFAGSGPAAWRAALGGALGWNRTGAASQTAIDFHYMFKLPAVHVVVLDTRTRRSYAGPEEYAWLIADGEIAGELGSSTDPRPLLLVSPAPLWGYATVEFVQEVLAKITPVDKALTWVIDHDLTKRAAELDSKRNRDAEAWGLVPEARRRLVETILSKYSAAKFVLVLSGDVHYGFSAGVNVTLPTSKRFIQLTSSATHNQEGKAFYGSGFEPQTLEDVRNYLSNDSQFSFSVEYYRHRIAKGMTAEALDKAAEFVSFKLGVAYDSHRKISPFNNLGVVSFDANNVLHHVYTVDFLDKPTVLVWTVPL